MKTAQPLIPLDKRIELIKKWLDSNKYQLAYSDRIRIVLNIKGSSIVPEITSFPEPIKKDQYE